MTTAASSTPDGTHFRIDWIDVARAYGMFLVFYGHFVETVYEFGNEPALLQQKLVYAFHMPLFIFISGLIAKTDLPRLVPFLKKQTLTRLLPFAALSLLIFPLHLLEDALDVDHGPSEIRGRYIDDWKELCVNITAPPEDQIAPARRRLWEQLPSTTQDILKAGVTSDSLSAPDREQVAAAFNALLDKPDLFARESLFLYSFYLLGMLLKRIGFFDPGHGRGLKIGWLVISAAILLFTFDLNPCPPDIKPVVLINLSQHGEPFYFAITAIAGCLAVVALARMTPAVRVLQYAGRHSLILMGMNGIFFHFGNDLIVDALTIPPAQLSILFWCTLMSAVTMAACLPLVWLLDRYIPQLMGKPQISGPLLPALLKRQK